MSTSHPPQPQPSNTGTTFFRTCLNGINALSGVGILSIPYALSEGGWLSLAILLLVATICCYTGLLLQRCMEANSHIKTYADIGELAFGRKGRFVTSFFVNLELYLVAVEFLILESVNLHRLFPNVHLQFGGYKVEGKQAFVMLSALVVLPTTWLRDLGSLAYVSFGGVLSSFILIACVVWVDSIAGIGFHSKGSLWRWNGLPSSISMFTFCYCAHPMFPTLYNSINNKRRFPQVLLVCFILSTITYSSMAVLGYLMFGETLTSQITLNLPAKNLSTKIAICTTLINPITKFAIVVSPVAAAIEDMFPFWQNHRTCFSISIRTVLVASTVFVALAVPFFGYVMAFIGAFLSATASITLPCMCYLKIHRIHNASGACRFELMVIIVILVFGVSVSGIGTYVSLKDIIKHLH